VGWKGGMASHKSSERRWALITEDGRHAWLGRHSDPSEEELSQVAESLSQQGIAGWLAVTEGVYYGFGKLDVMLVRSLHGNADWDAALTAFNEHRQKGMASSA
jgi:hypothetical protein